MTPAYQNIILQGTAEELRRELGFVPSTRTFRVLLPIAAPFTLGNIVIALAEDGPAPPPPPVLLRQLLARLPRHAVGARCTDPDGIMRRVAMRPSRPLPRDWDPSGEGARLDDECYQRAANEPFALGSVGDFALWPWGEAGKRDDEQREQREASERAARERAEREAAEAARLSEESLEELGLVAFELRDGGRRPADNETHIIGTALFDGVTREHALEQTDDGLVFVFRSSIKLPEGRIKNSDAHVLPSSYVPRVTKATLRAKTLNLPPGKLAAFLALRGVPSAPIDPTRLRDAREPEGEHAAEILRARVATYADHLVDQNPMTRAMFERRMVEDGVRGLLLAPELVRNVYDEEVGPRLPVERGEPLPVSQFFTEDGVHVTDQEVRRVPIGQPGAGRPYRVVGRMHSSFSYSGGYANPGGVDQVEFLNEETRFAPGPARPVVYMTDEQFRSYVLRALEGKAPWVDVDEHFTPPNENFLRRFASRVFGPDDAWLEVLREVTANRDRLSTEDLIAALTERGHISGKPKNADFTRLKRLMTEDGWTHRQVAIGNEHPRRWCRT